MNERVLKSRTQPTILIVGEKATVIREYLVAMLGESPWNVDAEPVSLDQVSQLRAGVLVVSDIPSHLHQRMRALMRVLPDRTGLFVGHGRNGELRRAVRGFHAKYRWFDESSLWVGSGRARDVVAFTAAARVAHELGVSAEQIRASVTA